MHHQSHAPRRWSRILLAALVLALVPLSAQLVAPRLAPRADAAGDLLCVGFGDCANKGYSDGGYQQHWRHMYWLMYSGRNCVNYAAYRMVASGLPDSRPWSGSGNAMNWGKAMSSITNQTPVVGAVAWWKAYAPGAGSLGHVAYVEKVVSPTQLIISESNWGSDFDWRVVNIDGDWPSGFIHFNDQGVLNTAAPVLDGDPQVGTSMSVTPGAWTPSASVSYQWLADGTPIKGQTAATYTPRPALLGRTVSVKVTATAKNYAPASVTQTAPAAIGAGAITTITPATFTVPAVATTSPDQPVVDDAIGIDAGSYAPRIPMADRSVQWYADGQPIDGATSWWFIPTQAQVDQQLSATVTMTHAGYQDNVVTVGPSQPVLAPLIKQDAPATIAGTVTRGARLTVDPGTFADPTSGASLDADVSYQWLRDGAAVPGATRATYRQTVADVGHRLAVQVTATHKNYRNLVTTTPVDGVVTTASWLRVTVHGMKKAARIRIRVHAPGAATLSGPVTVTVGGQTLTGQVDNGVAILGFTGLRVGERRVVVQYAGTSVILGSSTRTTVDVLPVKAPTAPVAAPAKPAKKK